MIIQLADGSCEPMSYGNRVILMTKDYLGEGSEELGRNLMKTFWVCMLEADVKPSKSISSTAVLRWL